MPFYYRSKQVYKDEPRGIQISLLLDYFRPHEALKGKTPAEKCGIVIEGEDKWKTVIENASNTCNGVINIGSTS